MYITLFLFPDFSQLSDNVAVQSSIWQDIFGVSNETAFIALVPLLIFILGLVLRWGGERYTHYKENKQKRKFIFSQVEVLIRAVSGQKKSTKEFIEILKTDKIQNLEFEIKVSFNPKQINQIGSNELFKILVLSFFTNKKKRLEIYNSLIKQLDLIEGLSNQFENSFNYILTHSSKYQKKWNENIKIIRELHDNWKIDLVRNQIDPKSDPFLYGFNDIYNRIISTKDFKDMYISDPNFIEPTLQMARNHLPNPYAQQLLSYLLECKDAIDNHRHLRKFKVEEFEQYLTQLDEIEKALKNFLKFYNYKINNSTEHLKNQTNEN